MKPLVAVMMRPYLGGPDEYEKHRNPVSVITALKEASLFFDKIAPIYITAPWADSRYASIGETAKVTILIDKARLWYDYKISQSLKINPRKHPRAYNMLALMVEKDPDLFGENLPPLENRIKILDDMTRVLSCALSEQENVDAIPILFHTPDTQSLEGVSDGPVSKGDVLQFVIHAMPKPSTNTRIEKIVEFRTDPETRIKLRRLRRWMQKAAESGGTKEKVADELESLIDEYEAHMKFHRMKVEHGLLETVVTTSAEIVEDMTKLRLGKLAKLPFAFKHQQIALLEAEQKAPGREIAYISAARRQIHQASPWWSRWFNK